MKTKHFLASAICLMAFAPIMAQNQQPVILEQQIDKDINFVRVANNASVIITIDSKDANRLQVSTKQDNSLATPETIKGVYQVVLDTLIIMPLNLDNGKLLVTLSSQPRKITLDSSAQATLHYNDYVQYINVRCNNQSKCSFSNEVNVDTLYCVAMNKSIIHFDTLKVKKERTIYVQSGAKFTATIEQTDSKAMITSRWDGEKDSQINFNGQSYTSGKNVVKLQSYGPFALKGIKRVDSPYMLFAMGANSIIQNNNGDCNAKDLSWIHAAMGFMIPINITNHQTFAFGLAIEENLIKMENPLTWGTKDGKECFVKYDVPQGVSNYKSELASIRLALPITYYWYMTDNRRNNIIGLTLSPSYSVYSRMQNSYKENGNDYTENIKAGNAFNNFHLNARVEYLIFGNFGVYVDCGLTPLLNTETQKRMNTLSIGLTFNSLNTL